MKILLSLLLLLSSLPSIQDDRGAVPDSLVLKLQKATGDDFQRARVMEDIASYYITRNEFDLAKPYADEIKALSENLNNDYLKVLNCYYEVIYLNKENDLQSTVPYLYRARTLMDNLDDSEASNRLRLKVFDEFALFYYSYNMLPQAYEYLNLCFRVNDKLNAYGVDFNLNRRLMLLYGAMNKHRECVELGKEIAGYSASDLDKSYYHMTMLDSYRELGLRDSAQRHADSAFLFDEQQKVNWLIRDRVGLMYLKYQEYDSLYRCSDLMAREMVDNRALSVEDSLYLNYRVHFYKAECYNAWAMYDSALYCADKALETVRIFVSLNDECVIMALKTDILRNAGRYKEALDNMTMAQALNDSLIGVKNIQNVDNLMFQQQLKAYEAEQQHTQYVHEARHRAGILIMAMVALLFLSGSVILVLIMKKRKMRQQMLEEELEDRNRELASTAVVMMKKNETYSDVIATLKDLGEHTSDRDARKTLAKVSKKIEQTMEEGYYDEFDVRFKRVHPDFIAKLTKKHPDLTPNEIKICSFLKLNMSTKEIASLTGQSVTAIEKTRYRIRRKLGISIDDHAHLSQYIMKI